MRNFQNRIQQMLSDRKRNSQVIALFVAFSMIISFVVPYLSIVPGVAMTSDDDDNVITPSLTMTRDAGGNTLTNYAEKDGNIVDGTCYSPKEMSEVALLIGVNKEENWWANGCTTAEEVIERAKSEYFLGIAYDFCLFSRHTVNITNADAEGRVAVGGDLNFIAAWNYQIGSGNYGYSTALIDTDDYKTITGFAHAIAAGTMRNINMFSAVDTGGDQPALSRPGLDYSGKTMYFPVDEDRYKRFILGTLEGAEHYIWPNSAPVEVAYDYVGAEHNHSPIDPMDETAQIYQSDSIINFDETYDWLCNQSLALSKKTATGTTKLENGNQIIFYVPDEMQDAETVYFDLPDEYPLEGVEIHFENVPMETTQMVIRDTGNCEKIEVEKKVPKCNLVVNSGRDAFRIKGDGNLTKTFISYHDVNVTDEISNTSDTKSNNHPASSKILYNFYNAHDNITEYDGYTLNVQPEYGCSINGNFNGTIFAPKANVKSNTDCTGHLSGALICNSFYGGLEIGYRPYRGKSSILGTKSGYVIPVDKLITGTGNHLAGASFTLEDICSNETCDNKNTVVNSWTSATDTKYATLPSAVDYTGKTNYKGIDEPLIHTYKVSEKTPPKGYFGTEKYYTVTVKEEIVPEYLILVSEKDESGEPGELGTIPQVVNVTITIVSSDGSDPQETLSFTVRDAYDFETYGQIQRQIVYSDNTGYALNFDDTHKVKKLGKIGDPVVEEDSGVDPDADPGVEDDQQGENGAEQGGNGDDTVPPNEADDNSPSQSDGSEDQGNGGTDESGQTSQTSHETVKIVNLSEPIIEGESLKTSWKIDDTDDYYDSSSMMVMPLPQSNLTFENKPGLLFTKVDDSGKELKGATITVTPSIPGWNWDDNPSSQLIDLDWLDNNENYKFEEKAPPNGYEKADPIYFKKVGGALWYCDVSGNPTEKVSKNDTGEYYVISMTDKEIAGAKIKLGKYVQADQLTTRLDGAKFQLLSGNKVVYPLQATTGSTDDEQEANTFEINGEDFDLFDVLKNAGEGAYDPDYVKNGYLKPGTYTLHEVTAPTGYQPQDFRFRVKSADGSYIIEALPSGSGGFIIHPYNYPIRNGNNVINKAYKEVSAIEADCTIPGSSVDGVKNLIAGNQINFQAENGCISGLDGWTNLFKSNLGSLSVTEQGSDKYTIRFELNDQISITPSGGESVQFQIANGNNITVTELRIFGEAGEGAGSGAGDSDGGDVTTGYYGDNPIIAIKGNVLETAKKNSDKPLIEWENANISGGQIHIITESNNNYDDCMIGTIDNGASKNYKFQDIVEMSGKNADDITGVRFMIWNGSNFGTYTIIEAQQDEAQQDETPSTPPSPEDTTTDEQQLLDLTVVAPENNDAPFEIKIPNQKPGTTISITAQKVWNDTGFESLRPESISVTLRRQKYDDSKNEFVVDSDFEAGTAELNVGNSWKKIWTGLPRLVNDEGDDTETNWYKYYVDEIDTSDDYTVSYEGKDLSVSGTITITNTLKTTNVEVTKEWLDSDGDVIQDTAGLPNVRVQLQWEVGETWENVDGKTLTLTAPEYKGSFKDLPVNKVYKVVESSAPNGWKLHDITGNQIDGFMVQNKPDLSSLTIKKIWSGDTADNRPDKVNLKLYRKAAGTSAPRFDPDITNNLYPTQTPEQIQQDYARLLQYSLYFYDANMCGSDVTEKSAYDWRVDCHPGDGDYQGGFHDAGDYVMFGLPQGFSASTLGWSYYEFKDDSYDKLGLTEHVETISQHFADFFMKAVQTDSNGNVTSVLYQKGNGDTDHSYWGMPENQDQRDNQLYWTDANTGGSDIAAEYSAALTLHYLNFGGEEYLEMAKKLYTYAKSLNSATHDKNIGFYPNSGEVSYEDDLAWAAAWLAVATSEQEYKGDCTGYLSSDNGYSAHQWANVFPAAKVVASSYLDQDYWNDIEAVLSVCTGDNFYNCNDWGNLRYNLGYQLIALAASKHNNGIDKTDWCKKQMAFILGNNTVNGGTCFVTGFADNSPKKFHYRATSGDNYNYPGNHNDYDDQYTLVGAVVGGPGTTYAYSTNRDGSNAEWATNEVALDYNANLVMAAAGLYAVYGCGETYSNMDTQSVFLSLRLPARAILDGAAAIATITTTAGNGNQNIVTDTYTMVWKNGKGKDTYRYTNGGNGWENVTKIEVVESEGSNGFNGGMGFSYTYNNNENEVNWGWQQEKNLETKFRELNNQSFDPPIKLDEIGFIDGESYWNDLKLTLKIHYVKGESFTVTPNTVKLHVGKTQTLVPAPDDGVTYSVDNEAVATVDENGVITARSIGTAKITVSRNGLNAYVDVEVVDALRIVGKNEMNKDSNQTLTAENAVGEPSDIIWNVIDGDDFITIEGGMVYSQSEYGTATVRATDTDGTTATFNITVKLTAADPGLPEDLEWVQDITLTKDNWKPDSSWTESISNLEKTDGSGRLYTYYIVEVDEKGEPVKSISGNVATYIPVSYVNGKTLNDTEAVLSVTNEKVKDLSITVKKQWSDSKTNEHLNDPVTIEIYRGTTKPTDFTENDLIVDAADSVSVGVRKQITVSANKPVALVKGGGPDKAVANIVAINDNEIVVEGVAIGETDFEVTDGLDTEKIHISVSPLTIKQGDHEVTEIEMEVGKPQEFTVLLDNKELTASEFTFTSANPNIVAVNGAELIPKANSGDSKIAVTATTTSGGKEISATLNVTVKLPNFTIFADAASVTESNTLDLSVSQIGIQGIYDYGTITRWESTSNIHATVDDVNSETPGRVHGISASDGQVRIVATRSDGKTAEYLITVESSSGQASDTGSHLYTRLMKRPNLMMTLSDEPEDQQEGAALYGTITLNATGDGTDNWSKLIELPAYDGDGNTYYYWAKEVPVLGYTPTYSFSDSDDDTTYCINATKLGEGIMTIRNAKNESDSVELPETGGRGTTIYYTVGGIVLLLSAAGYVTFKRRRWFNE